MNVLRGEREVWHGAWNNFSFMLGLTVLFYFYIFFVLERQEQRDKVHLPKSSMNEWTCYRTIWLTPPLQCLIDNLLAQHSLLVRLIANEGIWATKMCKHVLFHEKKILKVKIMYVIFWLIVFKKINFHFGTTEINFIPIVKYIMEKYFFNILSPWFLLNKQIQISILQCKYLYYIYIIL